MSWAIGEVLPLPVRAGAFTIVSSRFAFHHFLEPRAVLAEMVRTAGYAGPLELIPPAQDALARAEALTSSRDLTCITGSLSIVGEMRTLLGLTPGRAAYLDEAAVQALQSLA